MRPDDPMEPAESRGKVRLGHVEQSTNETPPRLRLQVVSVDWVFSFRIKFVGLGVIFGPHEVTENWAVLNILEGQ